MTRTPRLLAPLVLLLAAVASPLPAEDDPLAGAFFPPDLVMRHLVDLELDEAQVGAIKQAVGRAQPVFLDRQLTLQSEVGKLQALVRLPRVDPPAVLAQLDRVLALEREIKRAQIGLLMEIKNILRPEQQQRLRALQTAAGARP